MPSSGKASSITASLTDLLQGKSLLGHDPGQKRKVSILKMTPVPATKQLVIGAQAIGTSLYTLTMSINGFDYSTTKTSSTSLTVSLGNGDYLFTKPISINGAKVQVRCSCADFYFTWSYWDKQTKTLSGPAMKPYKRKTTTYPERNARHVPGACKHIIELTNRLIGLGILKR